MSIPSYPFYSLPLKLQNKGISFPFPPLKLPNKEIEEFNENVKYIINGNGQSDDIKNKYKCYGFKLIIFKHYEQDCFNTKRFSLYSLYYKIFFSSFLFFLEKFLTYDICS